MLTLNLLCPQLLLPNVSVEDPEQGEWIYMWCVQNFSKWTEYFMKSCGIENPRARTNIQRISTFCMNHLKSMQGPPLPSLLPTTNRATGSPCSMVPPLSRHRILGKQLLGGCCVGKLSAFGLNIIFILYFILL